MNRSRAEEKAFRSASRFAGRLDDFGRIPGGMESEAYFFRKGSEEYVLRVNRDRAGFEKDAFAHERFARKDLPVPEVVEIGQAADGPFYCISRKLPGRTLQDLPARELSATLEATVQVMKAMGESPVQTIEGFGLFDASGKAPFATWREYLLSSAALPGADPGLTEIVDRFVDFCPEQRQLVHGDFGSNNVLSEGYNITGVLDWSEAMIGDPLYDVANVFFWRGWLDCMEALAVYLEKQMHPIANCRERVHCYQACIALREAVI